MWHPNEPLTYSKSVVFAGGGKSFTGEKKRLACNSATCYWRRTNPDRPWQPMKLPCSLPQIVSIASLVLDGLQNWQVLVRRLRLITVNF